MGVFNLQINNTKLALYDIGTLAAGFYIGYNEGKGIYTNQTVEYLAKYGPTVFTLVATPAIIKFSTISRKWMNKAIAENLKNGNLEIKLEDGTKKRYRELTNEEKQKTTPSIIKSVNNLELTLKDTKYLEPTITAGTITAIETTIGYFAGRLYSQLS